MVGPILRIAKRRTKVNVMASSVGVAIECHSVSTLKHVCFPVVFLVFSWCFPGP